MLFACGSNTSLICSSIIASLTTSKKNRVMFDFYPIVSFPGSISLHCFLLCMPYWPFCFSISDGSNKKSTSWVQDCMFRGKYRRSSLITGCILGTFTKHWIILSDILLYMMQYHIMQDIRKLFPSDYNPFYAGFGNRDTDELSYRRIGIPKGKIFIINPKVFIFNLCFCTFQYFVH